MSTLFVRHGGKTLGPLAAAQIEWLLSRGKITRAAELSADRVNWQPLVSHPSFGGGAALPLPLPMPEPIPISGQTTFQQPMSLPTPIPISGQTTIQLPPPAPADDDYELTLDLDGNGNLDGIN
jgi:hypothetical protein